jgi:membrane-associated phospholipid phosphatase
MRRVVLVLAVALSFALGAVTPARAGIASAAPWIEFELDAIASHGTNPPRASRALAHTSVAMYQAAVSGGGRDDAVAGAASTVIAYLFPDEATRVDQLVGEIANRKSAGFARGRQIGQQVIARAESDGSNAVWTGTPPEGPGHWVPTPPAFVYPPLEPLAGTWQTWNLASGSQLRPGPPPAYGSAAFLTETQEVYDVSRSLTDDQRRIATYWADGSGTVTPPGHWNVIALDLIRAAGMSTLGATRLLAALNTAQADAFIACWDAKYAYWTLRPVTAIRALIDPTWLPYIVTPPFPSYVSGHSTTSGAASAVLSAFFPDKAAELAAMAEEAAVSRLYGGIHFRSDNEARLVLGRRIGEIALGAYGT